MSRSAETIDPLELLHRGPMRPMQMVVVAICIVLTALDGFDVQAISFAAPGIATEWGINRAALGVVLSMELLGMAIGSMVGGALADIVGRRPIVLGCTTMMAIGMFMASRITGLQDLELWRVFTGIGIGGLISSTSAVAAEFASVKRRDLCVALMAVGFPLGALFGGAVVVLLLKQGGWRDIFSFGALVTCALIPIAYWWVPESVSWLVRARPAQATSRVNRALLRLGYPVVEALPTPVINETAKAGFFELFRPAFLRTTVLTSLTYFLAITTFYFIVKWVPKIVVDMGFPAYRAAGVLVWTNVGGALGGALLGFLSHRYEVRRLTVVLLMGSLISLTIFGHGQSDLNRLSLVCAFCGFCANGAVVGIFAILARAFPTDLRASGTGFVVGSGRGGAMFAPMAAGLLFQAGYGLQGVAITIGIGSLLAAVCLSGIHIPARTVSS